MSAGGDLRTVEPDVIDRLRRTIGQPDPHQRWPIVLRAGAGPHATGPGTLRLEDGTEVAFDDALTDVPLGYHRFASAEGWTVPVISAPDRCHLPPEGQRSWGWSAQLYATRSRTSWGLGDLADLRRLATWSAGLGAGFVLINPIGATAPVGPQQPSPYSPASRRFRNPIYLRVEDVPGAEAAGEVVRPAAIDAQRLNEDRAIDRDEVWALKLRALAATWSATTDPAEFDAWLARQPASLTAFATWSVLAEQHGPAWPSWPEAVRRPDGPGVAAAVAAHPDRIRFHAWLQWNLEVQLGAAARELAILQDLPIGVDPAGFDAWTWQDVLAEGTTVGAPPDELNTGGQDWGLPPFTPWRLRAAGYQPFIDTVRASMATDGGLRIDHVMGLFRLWWIPSGGTAADGAFVRYPVDDLLAIVALESHRNRAVVVGEDLGTVEDDARQALAEQAVLSYRLLWFEDDDPSRWPVGSLAAITTHDLPTVAGLWSGSDLAEQDAVGLDPNREATGAMRADLEAAARLRPEASPETAVLAAHHLLGRAPSLLVTATLDDACGEERRPNIPGAPLDRGNWCLALPRTLEEIEQLPLALAIAEACAPGSRTTPLGCRPPA